ncbi:MAG: SOS response-associated peptidase [Synechococcales cyanobacterium]
MCGRFSLTATMAALSQHYQLDSASDGIPPVPPSYNITPSQVVIAITASPSGSRTVQPLRWGLVPAWKKTFEGGLINARSETAAQKPSFRQALRQRRCLIAADGFYEWHNKQPYFFRLEPMGIFSFAGLWERWRGEDGTEIDTCTILNTSANSLMRPLHERMPVILHPHHYDLWLDPQVRDPHLVQPLLQPYPSHDMVAYPVSPWVNSPRHNDARCQEPLTVDAETLLVEQP